MWPDINVDSVRALMVLGIQLPQGEDYHFCRQGVGTVGGQVICTGATASVVACGVRVVFKFEVKPELFN